MGIFEYVSVLTSIIIGLGIAHLLQGVATLVQHPDRYRAYWVHLVWVAFMFFQASFFWWWEFALESLEQWTFEIYLFLLLYSVIIYLLCALLFPRDLEGYSGFEEYFIARRAWFLGLLVSFYLVDFVDTSLKGSEHFASLGWEYPVSTAITVVGCLVGILTKERRFHGAFAVLLLAYQLWWAFRNYLIPG